METLLSELRESDRDDQQIHALLSDDYDFARARRLLVRPVDKASMLTVLAWKNPTDSKALLELAERLNFNPGFPHRLISNAIATVRLNNRK